MFPVYYHKLGRTLGLALAMAILLFTFTQYLHCIATSSGRRLAWPWLWQSYCLLSPCVSSALPQAEPGAWPGLDCGNLIVHFPHVLPLYCHKLGRAFRLALAEANILLTCSLSLHCHAGLASMKSFHSTALYRTYNLFFLMSYSADLASVEFAYSRILH